MSLFDRLGDLTASYLKSRNNARTQRIISGLPAEVQKDIGWPHAWETRVRRNIRSAEWYGR